MGAIVLVVVNFYTIGVVIYGAFSVNMSGANLYPKAPAVGHPKVSTNAAKFLHTAFPYI